MQSNVHLSTIKIKMDKKKTILLWKLFTEMETGKSSHNLCTVIVLLEKIMHLSGYYVTPQ